MPHPNDPLAVCEYFNNGEIPLVPLPLTILQARHHSPSLILKSMKYKDKQILAPLTVVTGLIFTVATPKFRVEFLNPHSSAFTLMVKLL